MARTCGGAARLLGIPAVPIVGSQDYGLTKYHDALAEVIYSRAHFRLFCAMVRKHPEEKVKLRVKVRSIYRIVVS